MMITKKVGQLSHTNICFSYGGSIAVDEPIFLIKDMIEAEEKGVSLETFTEEKYG